MITFATCGLAKAEIEIEFAGFEPPRRVELGLRRPDGYCTVFYDNAEVEHFVARVHNTTERHGEDGHYWSIGALVIVIDGDPPWILARDGSEFEWSRS